MYQAFLYLLSLRETNGIQTLLGNPVLEPRDQGFGRLCLLTAQEQWPELCAEAHALNQRFRVLYFFQFEALGQLALGHGQAAWESLARFGVLEAAPATSWLQALIAVSLGRADEARAFLVDCLQRPLAADEVIGRPLLLRLWDDPAFGAISFNYPLLPPGITGLDHTVIRTYGSAPVLTDLLEPKLDPCPLPVAPGGDAPFREQVYVSYAWSDESSAHTDLLDAALQEAGIDIYRDNKDIPYKASIAEFMASLGRGRAVLLVISKKYLESQNCMNELIQISEAGQFHKRIFPFVLPDTKIYDAVDRLALTIGRRK